MKRIYLIRHGECDSLGTYVGRGTDLSLNAVGRESIANLGEKLNSEGVKPVKIITSALTRASESGSLMAEKLGFTPPLLQDHRLDEMDFGLWEGLTYGDICRDYPQESTLWVGDNWNNAPPQGESTHAMAKRVTAFYQDSILPFEDKEGDTLLVAHGGSLRMLLCLFMGIPPQNQWQFRLDRSGVAALEICGDTPVLFSLS
jgi:broad specificity phosphatase PhoE